MSKIIGIDLGTTNSCVSVIEAGEQFDPTLHNAVMHEENGELDANVIVEVFQKGYKINDKVVRPAMVKTAN